MERSLLARAILGTVRLGVLAVGFVIAIQPDNAEAAVIGTANTLVVVRVGDGTTALSGNAAAVFLEEYAITYTGNDPTGAALIQSIPVSAVGATPGTKLTMGGTGALEGSLSFSANGQYMMFGGYDAIVGATAASGNNRRIVGRVDLAGIVSLDAIYGTGTTSAANALRTVTSSTGNEYWFGQSASPGIAYRTWENGNNAGVAATSLNTLNTRRLEIFNNQLYVGSASGTIQGVATVGSGTPTTAGQTVTILPGMPTAAGPSSVDFFFADANTLYVADDRTFNSTTSTGSTNGGLQKWVFDGSSWSLAYTKNIDTTNDTIDFGLRGLAGSVDVNGNVTLFGTSTFGTTGAPNFLVGISDTLSNTNPASVTVNSLTGAAANTTFRGLEDIGIVVPEPTSLAGIAAFGVLALSRRRRD